MLSNFSDYQWTIIGWSWIVFLIFLVTVVFYSLAKNMTRKRNRATPNIISKGKDAYINGFYGVNAIGIDN